MAEKPTLRDRRHQEAIKDLSRQEARRDQLLDRLTRIAARIKAVRRSIERYERTPKPPAGSPTASVNVEPPVPSTPSSPAPASPTYKARHWNPKIDDALHGAPDDLEIPGFLKRVGSIGGMTPGDIAALEQIERDKVERKRLKARGRTENKQAKRRGDTKRMPLQGKAAVEAIRRGAI